MCKAEQETVSHIMCGCSSIAQGTYKCKHKKMLRPLYHFTMDKYRFEESEAFYDKENNKWTVIEGTVCNIVKIQERELYKQVKYTELRAEIEIQQINAVFEFLEGYNKTLQEKQIHFTGGKQTAKKVTQQRHKWILSQNCEIAKYFHNA